MIELLKTLGDDNRLRIIQLLKEKPLCVCEIETLLEMKQSNVSRHLNKLKQSKIIEFSKKGQWVYYEISKVFLEEHSNIMIEIDGYFKETAIFIRDLSVYKKYISEKFDCDDIKRHEEVVILTIRGDKNEK